ncbi:putative GntR family transcriptional regulator [Selenomonas ruminantium subsp. lactilytica TAM6421]|uniref:Putative GntR family transcriptional regulator n=1 Tax=Selenomonas ruminantium subsp. lactilytica (strain NBRC 103574 / TAM6421) TaxID=927704 RepID=I0GM12_SELRL|nr:PLP-dependent aminotransferase family protein [Selenomonas ruminantium]BAL81799.1 putative GntR family transcriptional regulator [Selenomonas ruminantium subsp. lactilytica TAM6421]
MLTYSFEHMQGKSLYEHLYRCIRQDILSGKLSPGEKLPSKRALARNLGISVVTVEGAYNQLLAEGYCESKPRRGFFVLPVPVSASLVQAVVGEMRSAEDAFQQHKPVIDLTASRMQAADFPFATWSRLMRQTLAGNAEELLAPSPGAGILELRQAIAGHLQSFRGLNVSPEQIVMGAGTEYLYTLLIQFFGRDKKYCLEDPGYERIRQIYRANGADYACIGLDGQGICLPELRAAGAEILHISPSHHFPTGIVMPVSRRYDLLGWVAEQAGRYIIEDDYDSEFRLQGRPIPTLMESDRHDRVIYMNTFSKSLTPTIRISYMVLPPALTEPFRQKMGCYSCTVANFEQYTLARFIGEGYFEKHINRMRTTYRRRREKFMELLQASALREYVTLIEHGSGLHLLLRLAVNMPDKVLQEKLRAAGVRIRALGEYYDGEVPASADHVFVLNYANLEERAMKLALDILGQSLSVGGRFEAL